MAENIIKNKTFDFSIEVVNLSRFLVDEKREFILSKQFLRSGTAIGALVRESEHAESKMDFIHKLAIAQKESNETEYWLDLLYKTEYIHQEEFDFMKKKIIEINKILSSIIITTKQRVLKEKQKINS